MRRLIVLITAILSLILPVTALAIDNVANVQATAGDGTVSLSWDPVANANYYRIYHGTSSISGGSAYDLPTITTDTNSTNYTVTGLDNGITYFFSVTAVDNSSESEQYSNPEVSATPQSAGGAGNTDEFTVMADATDNETITLTFSHPVVIPVNATSAFNLTYEFNGSSLDITNVSFANVNDEKTVLVKTLPQEPGGQYMLTIPTTLISKDTNAPLSENERVIDFVADSTLQASAENGDIIIGNNNQTIDPIFKAVSAESLSETEILVTFNNPVVLPEITANSDIDPFTVINNDNPQEILEVTNFTLDASDPTKVLLTTSTQTASAYTIVVALVTDVNGTQISTDFNVVELGATSEADNTPPEDVTNLSAVVSDLATLAVSLTFTPSLDSANDLNEYIVYLKQQGASTYEESIRIAKSAEAKAILRNLTAETTYDIKVTARDNAGNESEGTTTTVTLPETGPGVGILAFGSLILARARRKKRYES